jgi:hypothetical protein
MGTMIAQAGLMFGHAMMAVPKSENIEAANDIIERLLQFTTGAREDSPIPVTVCCYLARVIKGEDVIRDQPDMEDVLFTLESWAHEGRSWNDLRALYGKAMALTTVDVNQLTGMLRAIRKRLAAAE